MLARKDIPASYHLCVTHDDALQGVTLVTRGEDLLPATDLHRLLQALMGWPEPGYAHHALLTDAHAAGGWPSATARRRSATCAQPAHARPKPGKGRGRELPRTPSFFWNLGTDGRRCFASRTQGAILRACRT